jgi:hypothetical protein
LLLLLFQFVGPLLLAVFVIQRRPRSDNRSHFGFFGFWEPEGLVGRETR